MPKPMYVWSGSAWVSVATEVESLAAYATQSYADNTPGARLVVPTSVAVGSGSGSVGTSGAITFSGASSVSINGCFSSAYDNYRIVANILNTDASAIDINFRLRLSGTDASGSNYIRLGDYLTTAAGPTRDSGTATTVGVAATGSNGSAFTMDVFRPYVAEYTRTISNSFGLGSSSSSVYRYSVSHSVSTAYDGCTFYVSSGVGLTGNIRIYGMKN